MALLRWYRYQVYRQLGSDKIIVLRCRSIMTAIHLAAKLNMIQVKEDSVPTSYHYEEIP